MTVSKATKKGFYPDGGNLYLQVTGTGAKSWVFRYMYQGKARMMGLGAVHVVSLAEARQAATEFRKSLSQDIDPLAARHQQKEQVRLQAARQITFEECAKAYIEAHKSGWRNAKHTWQWENTLRLYVYPVIGLFPVQEVDVALVMKVLEPIWRTRTETASRVRGRIESILDWAAAREYRTGENPARWRGKLENLLPRPSKIQKVQHHNALPYNQVASFMAKLREEVGQAARALELVILTAARTSEVIEAEWQEFDLEKALWTIPAGRIKSGREHRVPLSKAALAILNRLHNQTGSRFLFPSKNKDRPLSNMAMLVLLRRMERHDLTVHGFRSTFRDWVAEQTSYPREIAEAALSHATQDKVEAAYLRSDFFEKRRQMMEEWAGYCTRTA